MESSYTYNSGGLHGKDLSKADVAANIYCFQKANAGEAHIIEASCAIGDEIILGEKYSKVVDEARKYIENVGGFEKFAEWGLW